MLTLLLFASPLGIQMGNLIRQAFIGRPDVAAWSRWEFTPLVLEFILCELRKGLSATRDGAHYRSDEEVSEYLSQLRARFTHVAMVEPTW